MKNGCSVVCVGEDSRSIEDLACRLEMCYPKVEEIGPRHWKGDSARTKSTLSGHVCDLLSKEDIRRTARKIKDERGRVDVLVTCVGTQNQDIFDTASRTLMSHFWVNLALV